jgi:hypothetical protein
LKDVILESCIIHQIKENVFVFLILELVFPISIYRNEIQNVGSTIDMEHVVFDITEEVLIFGKLHICRLKWIYHFFIVSASV